MTLDPAVSAAIIGAITTVGTAVAGVAVLLWRLQVEARRAIKELKVAEAMKLKLRVYENDVVPVAGSVCDSEVDLSSFIRNFTMQVASFRSVTALGQPGVTPSARINALIELKTKCDREALKILSFVETWLVVDPRLSIFKTAFAVARYEIDPAWQAYFSKALTMYPVDLAQGTVWTLPSLVEGNALSRLADELIDKLGNLTCYAIDFKSEMQSVLIGPLFGHVVPIRRPMDPRLHAISLKEIAALERYFDQTPWAIERRATEDRVRKDLQSQGLVSRV